MAQPVSLLGDIHGMARDFALDLLPKGYVWDLVDYIPKRRGARMDSRQAWKFLTAASALGGIPWGGKHASFRAGPSLLVACSNGSIYPVDTTTGAVGTALSGFATGKQNGVMLTDRCWFADGAGASKPKYVTKSGTTHSIASASGAGVPNASLLGSYKSRLITAGDPANPQRLTFSPLESVPLGSFPGPPTTGAWDTTAIWDTSLAITALWPMSAQILLFHDGSIEKLRGTIPPGVNQSPDMYLDSFSDQIGCSDPASVVGWQENVIWAAPRGVYLSDGATIRSLTTQGGIGAFWRSLYNVKRAGTQVVCSVFLDLLFVSVLTDWDTGTPHDLRPFTLVCDLSERSWWRFANVGMTAAIPSTTSGEEIWWGVDGVNFASTYQNRLSRFSDMAFTESAITTLENPRPQAGVTPADQIDGNGVPVLPQIETGFIKLGPEGVKRFRHLYVSHTTETASPTGDTTNKLHISYRLRPYPYAPYVDLADIPGINDYKRYRVRLDKRGYGLAVKVEQTIPTWLSRLHDVAVDAWAQDRGKL